MKIQALCEIDPEDLQEITIPELVEIFDEWGWQSFAEIINEYCREQAGNVQALLSGVQKFPTADFTQTAKEFLQKISGATDSQRGEEETKNKNIYEIGDKFKREGGEIYILSKISLDTWILVNIINGTGYGESTTLSHKDNFVTKEEFSSICNGFTDKFTLIEEETNND